MFLLAVNAVVSVPVFPASPFPPSPVRLLVTRPVYMVSLHALLLAAHRGREDKEEHEAEAEAAAAEEEAEEEERRRRRAHLLERCNRLQNATVFPSPRQIIRLQAVNLLHELVPTLPHHPPVTTPAHFHSCTHHPPAAALSQLLPLPPSHNSNALPPSLCRRALNPLALLSLTLVAAAGSLLSRASVSRFLLVEFRALLVDMGLF